MNIFQYTAHGLTIVILEITEGFSAYEEICYKVWDVRLQSKEMIFLLYSTFLRYIKAQARISVTTQGTT